MDLSPAGAVFVQSSQVICPPASLVDGPIANGIFAKFFFFDSDSEARILF